MAPINHKVLNGQGKESGSIELDASIFDREATPSLVHSAVVSQRNKRRSGNHSALTKAEVSGGGKKPWKQKGTGRARAGSNTSPLWVGGGVTHGPKPRDYSNRFSKQERRYALAEALTARRREEALIVLDKLAVSSGKTKDFAALLDKLGLGEKKVLAIVPTLDSQDKELVATIRACRNIERVKLLPVSGVNVYDVVNSAAIIGSKDAIQALESKVKGVSPVKEKAEKKTAKKAAPKKSTAKKA